MKDRTKKLLKIGGLAAALALIGGTFAFTNFGQRVLNITEDTNRPEHGGRVHDYFDDASGNKDVFAENFGTQPIFVRVKLTELMTKNDISVVPGVDPTSDPEEWPAYIPEVDSPESLSGFRVPLEGGDSNPLDIYYRLALGNPTHNENRPWFMPTFNLTDNDESAAAGTAHDVAAGGVTHPGAGTAGYWQANQVSNALDGRLPPDGTDSTEEHPTRQVLNQDHSVITFEQWAFMRNNPSEFPGFSTIGNYWVVDETTGWAYWANILEPGQATSFYVDAKLPQSAGLGAISGDWNYTLHVIGGFAGTTQANVLELLEDVVDVNGATIWHNVATELELEGWDD